MPFAGMLLSIASMPLLAPTFWHHHFGKIAARLGAGLPAAVRLARLRRGAGAAALAHTLVAEYLPFIILLTALFTAAGGICGQHPRAELLAPAARWLNGGRAGDRRFVGHGRVDSIAAGR